VTVGRFTRKALRDVHGAAIGAGVAVFLVVLLHAASFPSYDQIQVMHSPDALKGIFGEAGSISSPEGYTGAYVSNITVPLAIFTIVLGTRAIASEEEAGTLDLLLSQPVGRPRLLLSKAVGLALGMALAVADALPAFLLGGLVAEQQMSVWRFLAAVVSLLPFVAIFLSFGLWAGALLSNRALAGTVSAAVVVAMYFLNAIGGVVE